MYLLSCTFSTHATLWNTLLRLLRFSVSLESWEYSNCQGISLDWKLWEPHSEIVTGKEILLLPLFQNTVCVIRDTFEIAETKEFKEIGWLKRNFIFCSVLWIDLSVSQLKCFLKDQIWEVIKSNCVNSLLIWKFSECNSSSITISGNLCYSAWQ